MYDKFAAVYEEKIREDFSYPEMARFIREQVSAAGLRVRQALDLGCGTGNASAELMKDFDQLVLCDPSSDMLTLARGKFRAPYLPVFLQANAPQVRLPDRFDLIFSVLDVFNYMTPEEVSQSLVACHGNLKARGLMIFDISSQRKLEETARTGVFVYDDEAYFHVWENRLEKDRLELTINLFVRDGASGAGRLYERIIEEQTMYLHPVQDLEKRIRQAGFRLLGRYDGYTKQPGGPDSGRLVYVIEKETEING